MICAVHQPQTFPYLGYFAKMMQADCFVYLDNVQFKKNEWQNRNRIKSNSGWQWLTVPILHHFGQSIQEVAINPSVNWQDKHLQMLQTCYGKAPYFLRYFQELKNIYQRPWQKLVDFNLTTLEWLKQLLGIKTPTYLASEIIPAQDNASLTADERLITICKILQADTYLSGAGGHAYLNTDLFPQNNINLIFQNFQHPSYPQLFGEFIPYLSILDLIFNCGEDSQSIIRRGML
jgi:hypothetical protein